VAESISIALATYNGAPYLRQQLDSLMAQTVRPVEIVLCDDGSTDDTVAIARAYAADAPIPMRIIQNEQNLGWRANFMQAAALCLGDLIAFCDQDDVWNHDKLREVVQRFEPDVLMVYHNAEVVDGELCHKGTLAMQRPDAEVMLANTLDPWISLLGLTITFRRELLLFWPLWANSVDKYAPGHRAAHDQWVCFLASSLGTTVYTDQQLLQYRLHGKNTVGIGLSSSIRGKIAYITGYGDVVALYQATAESRVAALAAIARTHPPFTERAAAAADIYRDYHVLLTLQATIYRDPSLTKRLKAAAELRRRDAYRGRRWGLTRAMGPKDLLAAIAGPPMLRSLRRTLAQ